MNKKCYEIPTCIIPDIAYQVYIKIYGYPPKSFHPGGLCGIDSWIPAKDVKKLIGDKTWLKTKCKGGYKDLEDFYARNKNYSYL